MVGTTGSGDPALLSYTFAGNNPPLEDFDNTFQFLATSNAVGELQLTGQSIAGGNAVFINAFQLDQIVVPEPASIAVWTLLGSLGAFWYWRRRRAVA